MSDIMEGEEWLERMTPREMRHFIRTTQEDLKRAVEDRRKLMEFVKLVYDEAWEGMGDTTNRIHARGETFIDHMAGWEKFSFLCDEAAKVKVQVEGK